jgi:hypothetical protein
MADRAAHAEVSFPNNLSPTISAVSRLSVFAPPGNSAAANFKIVFIAADQVGEDRVSSEAVGGGLGHSVNLERRANCVA